MKRLTRFSMTMLLVASGCGASSKLLDPAAQDETILLPGSPEEHVPSPQAYEHQIRGELLAARGDIDGAVLEYASAIDADPRSDYLRAGLALLLLKANRPDEARRHLMLAIEANPTSELAWIGVAELYLVSGDEEHAIASASLAARSDPTSALAELWLARRYRAAGEKSRAAELYRRILELEPLNEEARLFVSEP